MNFDCDVPVESLYLHWPFCPYKCHFCPFVALAAHDEYMYDYHRALHKEIVDFSKVRKKVSLSTIFIGGGTPSTYPEKLLLDTFDTLYKEYTVAPHAEISLEVNPGTVTPEKLKTWRKAGINRLSIGVQSLDDAVLQKLNRHQKAADVYRLLDMAGPDFDNLSVDLIIGLPGVQPPMWKELLAQVVTWPIKHVSLYILMVHEDTPLYFGVASKRIALPADDQVIESYLWSIHFLEEHGFEQYEISNFAKQGYSSRHNSAYWLRKPYKGLGLGACSFDGKVRFQNTKNLMDYMKHVSEGISAVTFSEILTERQIWLEELMLGMRQTAGTSCTQLMARLSPMQQAQFQREVIICREGGFLAQQGDRILLTPKGRALEHEVLARLAQI